MAENNATIPQSEEAFAESKGKGKAADYPVEDAAMDEDDDDEDDDEDEDEVPEPEEDGMEEIDLNNIVDGGRRTRGQTIDFAKAAEEHPEDDYDEEEDEDFHPPDEDVKMSD
ncbi:histone chaperone domain CHZ-domain-containing protein [Dactylonectria estremocensis]|uniref:Histone chaperone domain CHZ-domain-containing protein n=1 Tax=Dactylonectria estremocensis TaxID=1079267 RepID=A0A9P9E9B6_9HYPO|nr:histone chaperone domain CHZ-domain-containing protein [Dactylonectria estremocensis]